MPNILPVSEYPDDFEIISFVLSEQQLLTNAGLALFYAEHDYAIDAVFVGVTTIAGAAATVTFTKTTSGTDASPASPAAATIAAGTSVTAAQAINVVGHYSVSLTTPASDTNVVRAGNWLGLVVSNHATTGARIVVQLRIRSRIA